MTHEHLISMACQQGPRGSIEDNAFSIKLDHPFNEGSPVLAFGVLDGAGGHAGGHVASAIGTTTLSSTLTSQYIGQYASGAKDPPGASGVEWGGFAEEDLLDVLRTANEEILTVASTHDSLARMASTVVCGILSEDQVILAWAGDSRASILHRGQLRQLTRDHSQVQLLIDEGLLSPDQAQRHPDRHVITCYLGCREGFAPEAVTCNVEPGDTILLCTDGVHDVLDEQALTRLIDGTDDRAFPDLADVIVDRAIEAGTTDNATALCLRVCGHSVALDTPTNTLIGDYAQRLADTARRCQLQETCT